MLIKLTLIFPRGRSFLNSKCFVCSVNVQNKKVLITGGSSGIGYALSQQLVDKGCFVYCWDKVVPEQKVAGVDYQVVDVTKSADIRGGCYFLPATIDVLVNNAGIIRRGTLFDSSEEDFDALFAVNVKAPWLVFKTIHEYDPPISVRSVVQVSSMHALHPPTSPALYTLTKQTAAHLAEMVERTYPDLQVKVAYPGPVDTPLANYGRPKAEIEQLRKIRHAPEFVAAKIVQLIESDNKRLLFDEKKWDYYFE